MKNGFAVLFDTNSYRQLVNNKSNAQVLDEVRRIRTLEAAKNIKAYGVAIVGMEMLSHLVEDENSFNYKDCLNGVVAMANHCFDDGSFEPRIIPHPYLHICNYYFGQVPVSVENRVKALGGVINDFKKNAEAAVMFHSSITFENINKYLEKEELLFSTQIIQLVDGAKKEIIKAFPNIQKKQLREKHLKFIEEKFEPFIAMAIISAAAQTLNVPLSNGECMQKAFSMNLEFPLSVGFYRWISDKIVRDNIDMESKTSKGSRWNWTWDSHVAFLISQNTLEDREIILVTSDGDIINMLNDFGYSNRVLTIQQYLTEIAQ